MNFDNWIDEFLLSLKQLRRSECTQRQYDWHLHKMAEYLEQQEEITDLTQVDRRALRHWGAKMAEQWSPATHRQAVAAMRAFFKFLIEEEALENNPGQAIKLPTVPKRRQRTMSAEEIRLLLKTADTLAPPRRERELALVSLLVDSGLRASEIRRVKMQNLDLQKGLLIVIGKGDKQAFAPFGTRTTARLETWLGVRCTWLAEHNRADPGTLFIALGGLKPGASLTPEGLRRVLSRLGEEAGVSKVSPHAFRRAFATLMSVNGAPSRLTQLAGRWSNIQMVELYTQSLENTRIVQSLYSKYSPMDNL